MLCHFKKIHRRLPLTLAHCFLQTLQIIHLYVGSWPHVLGNWPHVLGNWPHVLGNWPHVLGNWPHVLAYWPHLLFN